MEPSGSTYIALGQLKTLPSVGSGDLKTQISVNEDGTIQIQTISDKNLETLGNAIKNNADTIKKLEVAVKLIRGDKTDKKEKEYKTAKKMVKFYSNEMKKAGKPEKELALTFDNIKNALCKQSIDITVIKNKAINEAVKQLVVTHKYPTHF